MCHLFLRPGRCRNVDAFAFLGGTSPIPASSRRTVSHWLNRGGDRALNPAIHAIALTRIRSCPRTRASVARRTAEGKTTREIRRCLKRYIAREPYRKLNQSIRPGTYRPGRAVERPAPRTGATRRGPRPPGSIVRGSRPGSPGRHLPGAKVGPVWATRARKPNRE